MTQTISNISAAEAAHLAASKDNIVIITHARPDGDTLGSAFALKHALCEKFGKQVYVLCADPIPERLAFLCEGKRDLSLKTLPDGFVPKFVISVDTASLSLMGGLAETFGEKTDLKIDHHRGSDPFAAYCLCDHTAAACGEIIYSLIFELDALVPDACGALYAAIASDTGCFKYSNTTAATHNIAAELIKRGIAAGEINHALFESRSRGELAAMGETVSAMRFFNNGSVAFVSFTNEMKERLGLSDEELSDISSLPREVAGVKLAITVKQNSADPTSFKISMRTGGDPDASALCSIFGGGGHRGAAGATITASSPAEAEDIILRKVLEKL